ncbi:MAG: tRNA-binding protein [Gemmatimonadetes bacterium]|nr:MAG: tRNA-binding protein [Gemmatimonadota bacterium]
MNERKPTIPFDTFAAVDIRAGVVVDAEPFPEARKPAIKLRVDFGEPIGVLQTSAQLTRRYTPAGLKGTRVLGVVNFEPKRIAGFRSEFLVLGVIDPEDDGDVVLVRPDVEDVTGWPLG